MNEHRRWLAASIASVVLTTLLVVFVLELPLARLDVPYTFAGDTLDKLAQIRNVAETGWLFHSNRLGYPFGYDRLDFPRFDSLNYAIMGPVAALTGEAGLAINLYFIAGFYLIGLAALYSFRGLGLSAGVALLCSLLYAFLPYHVIRGVTHVTNGAYFLVPLGMLVLAWLARGDLDGSGSGARRRWLLAIPVAMLLPLQTPYNGVFFASLCLVAGAIAVAQRPRWRSTLPTAVLLAAVAAAFLAEQVPAALYKHADGNAAAVRNPIEAQIYSLHLNQVLLPTTEHRLDKVAAAKRAFDHGMKLDAPFYEIRNQYIGFLGVLGFIALLWALARAAGGCIPDSREPPGQLEINARIFALLAIAILLLAISSGIGNLIAYWVTSKIRAYNRILPFFAFASLLGAGWLLQFAFSRISNPMMRHAALAILGIIALLDLAPPAKFGNRSANIAAYDSDRAYFQSVERRLGDGAAMFQLPVVWYPEHPPVNRMGDYEEFKPFLLSKTLRISYGGARERDGYMWGRQMEDLAPENLIGQLDHKGFAAILIDGRAYVDDATLQQAIAPLEGLLPEPPSISPDRRWWMFPLAGCCSGRPAPSQRSHDAPAAPAQPLTG